MNFAQLKAFQAIANNGSVTRAVITWKNSHN